MNRIKEEMSIRMVYFISPSGKFIGFVPECPGVMSQADDLERLVYNIKDAYTLMLAYNRESVHDSIEDVVIKKGVSTSVKNIPLYAPC